MLPIVFFFKVNFKICFKFLTSDRKADSLQQRISLRKVLIKERSFRELIPRRAGPCPSLHFPPTPRKVCLLRILFALPVRNDP